MKSISEYRSAVLEEEISKELPFEELHVVVLGTGDGDGTFADITEKTGLSLYEGNVVDRVKAAAISDLDNDGDIDIIAGDLGENNGKGI